MTPSVRELENEDTNRLHDVSSARGRLERTSEGTARACSPKRSPHAHLQGFKRCLSDAHSDSILLPPTTRRDLGRVLYGVAPGVARYDVRYGRKARRGDTTRKQTDRAGLFNLEPWFMIHVQLINLVSALRKLCCAVLCCAVPWVGCWRGRAESKFLTQQTCMFQNMLAGLPVHWTLHTLPVNKMMDAVHATLRR